MKKFYLLRTEDVHGNSGTGVVAEGIVFDSGMAAMTWNSAVSTVTIFSRVTDVVKLHGHGGKSRLVLEGKDVELFERCVAEVRAFKRKAKK